MKLRKWRIAVISTISVVGLIAVILFQFYEGSSAGLSLETRKELWRMARPDLRILRSGDLIFRHGRGMVSNTLLSLSQTDKRYSHAGVLSIEDEGIFVYHCIGGEDNPNERMSRDRLSQFCDPERAHSFGIYRLLMADSVNVRFMEEVKKGFQQGVLFDTEFDINSDDRQYCTEFIYKILKNLEGSGLQLSSSTYSGKEYVACDNLYLIPNTKIIHHFNY